VAAELRRVKSNEKGAWRPVLCRFSDAGMQSLSTHAGGRRPKAPRHEIAVGGALAVPRAPRGIERGVRLKENDAKRSCPWLCPKAWVSLHG
jgi:hypothetical protein